jgi:putative ABC transport system permease protein
MNPASLWAWPAQVGRLTWIALLSLRRHGWRAASTVVGAMGVVGVLVSLLAIAQGYEQVLRLADSSANTMVLMRGANAEIGSTLPADQVQTLRSARGVARDAAGRPLASTEVFTTLKLNRRDDGQPMSVSLRGVEPVALALRGLRVTEGRLPQAGRFELLAGRQAAQTFQGLAPGGTVRIGGTLWTVVGQFGGAHGVAESELWADLGALQSVQERGQTAQVLLLQPAPGVAHEALARELERDPRLQVRALRESDYYGEQTRSLTRFVRSLGWGMALLMALGATFAALNAAQSGVSARLRELATFKALGFRDSAVLAAIVAESLLLALAGAALAAAAAWAVLDGRQASTMFFSHNYSQVVFAFDVAPAVLWQAAAIAAAIGVAGGWAPGVAALRRPLAATLAERR